MLHQELLHVQPFHLIVGEIQHLELGECGKGKEVFLGVKHGGGRGKLVVS